MNKRQDVQSDSKLASGDLSSARGLFVKLDTTGELVLAPTAITDKVYGVVVEGNTTGLPVSVEVDRSVKVVAAEALAVGELVAPEIGGKAQVAVATQFICGIVTKPAVAEDDVALVELFRTAVAVPS